MDTNLWCQCRWQGGLEVEEHRIGQELTDPRIW